MKFVFSIITFIVTLTFAYNTFFAKAIIQSLFFSAFFTTVVSIARWKILKYA